MATRRKREYAFHVKAKIIFENPSTLPFAIQGLVVTDKENIAKDTAKSAITQWLESDPETSYPVKEIRVTSTEKLIKDFLIQPKDAGNKTTKKGNPQK